MSAERYRSNLAPDVSRRTVLKLGLAGTAALFGLSLSRLNFGGDGVEELVGEDSAQKRYSASYALRTVEYDHGSSELGFDDIEHVFPTVARLYDAYIGTEISDEDNRPQIYVVREKVENSRVRRAMWEAKDASSEVIIDNFPSVEQLAKDYPERALTLGDKKAAIRGIAEKPSAAWVSGKRLFYNLEFINNPEKDAYVLCGENMCVRNARPFESFRSLTFHEIAHFDRDNHSYSEVSQELRDGFLRAVRYDPRREMTEVRSVGFRLNVKDQFVHRGKKPDGVTYDGFEEFYAEHVMYRVTQEAEFSQVFNYEAQYDVDDHRKFEVVLYQCGISLQKLADFHRRGDIESFCLAVAQGSGRQFDREQEAIEYGLRSFFRRTWQMRIGNWDTLLEDFPGIGSV